MQKRITLLALREYDKANDTSIAREIEMAVDTAILQFWRDTSLYGLQEAVLYLRGYARQKLADPAKVEAVAKMVQTIIDKIDPPRNDVPRGWNFADTSVEGNGFDDIETHPE
jgi:hypothetical protein